MTLSHYKKQKGKNGGKDLYSHCNVPQINRQIRLLEKEGNVY